MVGTVADSFGMVQSLSFLRPGISRILIGLINYSFRLITLIAEMESEKDNEVSMSRCLA